MCDLPPDLITSLCRLAASKELAQTSYFMATNSLHLTTMCLRYPPTIVACVCIHLACKWSKYEIPISGEVTGLNMGDFSEVASLQRLRVTLAVWLHYS